MAYQSPKKLTLQKMNSLKNLNNPQAYGHSPQNIQFASPMLPPNEDKKSKAIPPLIYDYKTWEEEWEIN